MKDQVEGDIAIRQYLLGGLTAENLRQFEERLMTDDDYFQQLLAAESELIDDYVSDALTAQQSKSFETHFLCTPERHEQLRFARAFSQYGSSAPEAAGTLSAPPVTHTTASTAPVDKAASWKDYIPAFLRVQHPATGLALACSLLIIIFGGGWMLAKIRRLEKQVAQFQTDHTIPLPTDSDAQRPLEEARAQAMQLREELQRERKAHEKSEQELARQREQNRSGSETAIQAQRPASGVPKPERAAAFAIALSTGLTRDAGGLQKVSIPPHVTNVQFTLELETDEYPNYRATLQTPERREIVTREKLKARSRNGSKIITFTIPARHLSGGDYLVILAGITTNGEAKNLGTYTFRVLDN
ncbi:MAG: hypothetical protein H7Y30_11665 [Pyrinomonadaceae bacterium]|nr:hypothetical protein [Pyrinomonadaceae bacterium]